MANYALVHVKRPRRGRGSLAEKHDVRFAGKLMELGRVRQLSNRALEYLGEVMNDAHAEVDHRLAAARCIVTYSVWREQYEDSQAPMLTEVPDAELVATLEAYKAERDGESK